MQAVLYRMLYHSRTQRMINFAIHIYPVKPVTTSKFRRALLFSLLALLASAGPIAAQDTNQLDWVPYLNLPPELKSRRAEHCQGAYVDPMAGISTREDPSQEPINADANNSEMQDNLIKLSGGVSLQQGYRELKGDEVEYDTEAGTGTLHGNVEFREPGVYMQGESAWVNSQTGEARMSNGAFLVHDEHIRGSAEEIRRREDEIIELDAASYTYCPPTNEVWVLKAEELELDIENGVGTARKAKFTIKDTPFFYLPYLKFPIDDRRKSGFLWPDLGRDSSGGVDIATPYYLNLAPNYDMTLTPRWVADRGVLGEVQARYLGPVVGMWDVGGSYIDKDDRYKEDFPKEDGSRWLAYVDQKGLVKERWRTKIEYTEVSDNDYLNDIGTTELNVRQSTHLAQRGQLDYLGDNWLAEVRVEQFQTIAKDIQNNPYKKLPMVTLNRTATEQDYRVNILYEGEFTDFAHDTLLTGQRLYNEVGVNYPMSWIYGFLKGTAKYRHINYELDEDVLLDGEEQDSPNVGAPLASLDGGLFFERELQWADSALLQTLEPRLYYLWSDFEEQNGLPNFDTSQLTFTYNQIFRETRFSGRDRLDDANQVSAGITTRFIDPASGDQKLYASIGQIYYFEDRRVNVGGVMEEDSEGSSAIAAELGFMPWNDANFSSSWLYDTNNNKLDETHLQLSWSTDKNRIFNLGYNWRRYKGSDPRFQDINQIDFSTALPINENWAVFFQTLYDLDEEDSINDLVGVEYNDCCWRVRVVHQRNLNQTVGTAVGSLVETKKATYLEFQLKGLGGVGTRVSSILEEFIRGYQSSDE
jgi:LPS-assembly protein